MRVLDDLVTEELGEDRSPRLQGETPKPRLVQKSVSTRVRTLKRVQGFTVIYDVIYDQKFPKIIKIFQNVIYDQK